MNTEPTCADLVQQNYEKEVECLSELFARMGSNDEEDSEEARTEFAEYGLCFDWVEPTDGQDGFFRYQLSWGGPSDEFQFYVNEDGSLRHTEYRYMDWYDGSSVDVDKEFAERLWQEFEDYAS